MVNLNETKEEEKVLVKRLRHPGFTLSKGLTHISLYSLSHTFVPMTPTLGF